MITNSTILRGIKMACRGFAVAMVTMPSSAYASEDMGLLWQDTATGEIGAWMLDNGPTPTGTLDLSAQCGPVNDCVLLWTPVQTSGNRILWDNRIGSAPGGGELGYWQFDGNGNVTMEPALADTCVPGGGCGSAQNRAIGNVTLNLPQSACPAGPTPCTYQGILWVDPADGNVVIWNMSNQMLGGTAPGASASVDVTPPGQAILTADFNGDGNTDILWFNKTSGVVSVSLLGGALVSQQNFAVLGTQNLSSTCSAASGCAGEWQIVGAADVNGDGHVDLTWFNPGTGQISSWLLDGQGNVTGTQTLSWTCSIASGCAASTQGGWQPLGYVTFPSCGRSGEPTCSGNACNPGFTAWGTPSICVPANTTCGALNEPACGPQYQTCNAGLVASFQWQQVVGTSTWEEVPVGCVSASSVTAVVNVVSQTLNESTGALEVQLSASARSGTRGVPFHLLVNVPFEPGIPFTTPSPISPAGAFLNFSTTVCGAYTITMSSLQGQSFGEETVSPPYSLNPPYPLSGCCDVDRTIEPCVDSPVSNGGGSPQPPPPSGGTNTGCQVCYADCGVGCEAIEGPGSGGEFCEGSENTNLANMAVSSAGGDACAVQCGSCPP